jgi:hypothetical protein
MEAESLRLSAPMALIVAMGVAMELNDDPIGLLSFSAVPMHPIDSGKKINPRQTLGMMTFGYAYESGRSTAIICSSISISR